MHLQRVCMCVKRKMKVRRTFSTQNSPCASKYSTLCARNCSKSLENDFEHTKSTVIHRRITNAIINGIDAFDRINAKIELCFFSFFPFFLHIYPLLAA